MLTNLFKIKFRHVLTTALVAGALLSVPSAAQAGFNFRGLNEARIAQEQPSFVAPTLEHQRITRMKQQELREQEIAEKRDNLLSSYGQFVVKNTTESKLIRQQHNFSSRTGNLNKNKIQQQLADIINENTDEAAVLEEDETFDIYVDSQEILDREEKVRKGLSDAELASLKENYAARMETRRAVNAAKPKRMGVSKYDIPRSSRQYGHIKPRTASTH